MRMNVQEEIKKLAYDFYEKSGRMAGRELEHWLRAEQIVMAKLASRGKIEATKVKPERPKKRAAAATEGTKPKRAPKKKTEPKPGEKSRKAKG
jgi:Protein of unknown function (DUF2934)